MALRNACEGNDPKIECPSCRTLFDARGPVFKNKGAVVYVDEWLRRCKNGADGAISASALGPAVTPTMPTRTPAPPSTRRCFCPRAVPLLPGAAVVVCGVVPQPLLARAVVLGGDRRLFRGGCDIGR